MDRRNFSKALLASTASMSALPALADEYDDEEESNRLPAMARVRLLLPAVTVVLTLFLILTSRGFVGVDLRNEVRQEPAEKLNTGKIPFLGKIFGPTLIQQFTGAKIIGTLYLLGTILFLIPLAAAVLQLEHAWITHRELVYKPSPKPKAIRLKNPPTKAQIMAGRKVGIAALAEAVLLAMVWPTALDKVKFKK